MKINKKQGLAILSIAAFIVTMMFSAVFVMPTRPAAAAEIIVPVSTEAALKEAVKNAETTPTTIKLEQDIEMNSISSTEGRRYYELVISVGQDIKLDLAGHNLSVGLNEWSNYTIANSGKLSIVDSSENYRGAVISNGYIYRDIYNGHSVENPDFSWSPTQVIYNYGELTINANIRLNCPESTGPGTDGYYTWRRSGISTHLIYNELYVPTAEHVDQNIYPASLTINGGNFDLNYDGGIINHFFSIKAVDLYINGGTFKNSSSTRPIYSGFLASIESIDLTNEYLYGEYTSEQRTMLENKIKEYRHVDIKITNGDFKDKNILTQSSESLLYITSSYADGSGYTQKIDGEGYTVSISGGFFPSDFSAYVDQSNWMELVQETTSDGEIIEEFYAVKQVNQEISEATVFVNETQRYYTTFNSAFNAAKMTQADTRTVKLLNDVQTEQLDLRSFNSDLKLDLNGHKLTIEPSSDTNHISCSNNSKYKNKLIICDTSEQQNGEFILSVKSGRVVNNSFIFINTTNTKFVLESGTIRQTGYLPQSYYAHGSANVGDSNFNANYGQRQSIFQFYTQITDANVDQYAGLITIKGGNIISDLNFGTVGNIVGRRSGNLVAWHTNTSITNKVYEFGFGAGVVSEENKVKVFVFDLDDYLEDGIKSCKFSWNFNDLLAAKGLTSNQASDGCYIVSKVKEGENFLVGSTSEKVGTLQEALSKSSNKDTIAVLQTVTVSDEVVIDKGITLNLNPAVNFDLTFSQGVSLTGGASICYGNITGNVTVTGEATIEVVALTGNVTVNNNGKLRILSGTYNSEFTVQDGASMEISGGSFRGSQISKIDKYFGYMLGAYKAADAQYEAATLYPVQLAPNLAAQDWYSKAQDSVYEISTTEQWLYFSLYVNSGIDNFSGKTVKLTEALNFDTNAANGISLAAEAQAPNFLPAGNSKNKFAGTFDGNNMEMSGIIAQERFVGLFGMAEAQARFRNIVIKNSSFMIGNGFLGDYNPATGYCAAGAIVGEGFLSGNTEGTDWSGDITLNGVNVGYVIDGQHFVGGVIGHSWGDVKIDGLKFTNATTVKSNWKMGGVVGYLDGKFYIKKADIEQGVDGGKNGLILDTSDAFFASGALVGHANGSDNVIEDCTILEHNDSLIGTTYARGENSNITIKGRETELDIYRVVGAGRNPGAPDVVVELVGEVTEEGIQQGSFKTQETEDYLEFQDEKGNTIDVEAAPGGGYNAQAKLVVDVTIGDINGITYGSEENITLASTNFSLFDKFGHVIEKAMYEGITISVTLKLSDYSVGKQVALIISYTVTGEDAENFNFGFTGNQAFVEVDVQPGTLYVKVDSKGRVSYEGFAYNEDEKVLGGELGFDIVDNGDGTSTVTPKGLESENYDIVYVGGVVSNSVLEPVGDNLWIVWVVIGAIVAVLGAMAIVFAVRKKRA